MIELSGVRYAVGPSTARWTAVATTLAVASYCGLAVAMVLIVGLPGEWSWPSVAAGMTLDVSTATYAAFVTVGGIVLMAIMASDQQRVVEVSTPIGPRYKRLWRSWLSSDAKRFLCSGVGFGAVVVMALSALPAFDWFWSARAGIVWWPLVIAAMCMHGYAMIRTTRRIRRDANESTTGQTDLYRDFEWDRLDLTDDVARFRERYRNRRWVPPSMIEHPRHAERLAVQARGWRWGWLAAAALIGVLFAVFAMEPLRDLLSVLVDPHADASWHASVAVRFSNYGALMACLLLLFTPVLAQQGFAADLDALAKLYEDCAAELREKRSRSLLTAAMPLATSLPPRLVKSFAVDLLTAVPPTEDVIAVIDRWQLRAGGRHSRGAPFWGRKSI